MKTFVSVVMAVAVLVATPAAADINYGDFVGESVMYLDVTESSATDSRPLFGAPTIRRDLLDFNPTTFSAFASGGSSDITDGQLNFTLMANRGTAMHGLLFRERGDYTLTGIGTSTTSAYAGLNLAGILLLEVDGQPLHDPVFLPGLDVSLSLDLINNRGILRPWGLAMAYNLDAALMNAGVPFEHGATKIEVVLDNFLGAISESGSIAMISKKDFSINVTVTQIPAPGAIALLGLAVLTVRGRRRFDRQVG